VHAHRPIIDCWVARPNARHRIGRVASHFEHGAILVDFGPDTAPETLSDGDWVCGLQPGFVVQDVPLSAARHSLGIGTIIALRQIAGAEQAAVQFHHSRQIAWIPYERLKRIMDARLYYLRGQASAEDGAERTALTLMAHGLRTWNEATGGLERLDIDPLPHQISLVNRILGSGSLNWLITDDVGLGKGIEIGLLLGALERRQDLRRVLIITPAALTRRWQDELATKFGKPFAVYGEDFTVTNPADWDGRDRVIASYERVRPRQAADFGIETQSEFERLLSAGSWDLVIFEEAQRLVRDANPATASRFELARALRARSDGLILLSSTPHRGDQGRFAELMRLVRPDLSAQMSDPTSLDAIAAEAIVGSDKAAITDALGVPAYKGIALRRIEVARNPDTIEFERRLSAYVRRGYRAAEDIGGQDGKALDATMTIYRRLASSSVFALALSLARRRSRLSGEPVPLDHPFDPAPLDGESLAELGDGDDILAEAEIPAAARLAFDQEVDQIGAILDQAKRCFRNDAKADELRRVVDELVLGERRKLLIFTEYRATQSYLTTRLQTVLGRPPAIIHAGMTPQDKRAAVEAFSGDTPVLISTEAGGEGLNLQQFCHVMVNYDLPWNLARLSQRLGRLYRYGQPAPVVAISLHTKDWIDNEILSMVLDRIEASARQLAPSASPAAQGEILLDLLERIEIDGLLVDAGTGRVDRTLERIDDAIEQARYANGLQQALLAPVRAGMGRDWERLGPFTTTDLARFIHRACERLGIVVSPYRDEVERFDVRLPEALVGRFPEFGTRQVIDCVTLRGLTDTGRTPLDFSSAFVRHLVAQVCLPEFGGGYGVLEAGAEAGLIAAFAVQYQNDQGQHLGDDMLVGIRHADGTIEIDNSVLRPLFEKPQQGPAPGKANVAERAHAYDAIADRIEVTVAGATSAFRHITSIHPVGVLEWEGDARLARLAQEAATEPAFTIFAPEPDSEPEPAPAPEHEEFVFQFFPTKLS